MKLKTLLFEAMFLKLSWFQISGSFLIALWMVFNTELCDDFAMDMLLLLCLGLLFFLTSVGNGIIPVPVTAYVLWMGHFNAPLMVIVTATTGSLLGWLVMGNLLQRYLFKKEQRAETLLANIPPFYRQFFLKWPGVSVFFFNALPLPFDPMRVLAMANNYSPRRLLTALAIGRLVRYSVLVMTGVLLAPYKIYFWSAITLFVLLPVAWKFPTLINWLFRRSNSPQNVS